MRALTLVALCAATAAQAQPRGTLVVVNKSVATASIIDVASGRLLGAVPTGTGPHEAVMTADGRIAVVSDYGTGPAPGSTLTIIDVPGRRVLRTAELGGNLRPHGLALLPGDSLVAVTSEQARTVVIVRLADGAVVREVPTDAPGSHMVAVAADGRRAWTGNIPAGTVSELDLTLGTMVRSLPVPPQPEAITVTADGGQVWVGSNSLGIVSAVDTRTGRVDTVATGLGWPYRILFTPDRRTVLIPDYRGGTLRVHDAATRAERGRVALTGGPQGIAVSPDSRYAYQSLAGAGRVAIIDLTTLTVVTTLDAGPTPDGIAHAAASLR